MDEYEILKLWKSGLSKYIVAKIYRRVYNEKIKLLRLDLRNRYEGRLISNYDVLAYVEEIIYKYIRKI